MEDDIAQILISTDAIQSRVRDLSAAISRDYLELNPVLIGILKGIAYFMTDLVRMMTIPVTIDFFAISTYGGSAGVVRLLKDLDQDIHGRHVLVIEDVIDTGLTLNYILQNLRIRNPATLKVCTLFNRPRQRLIDIPIAYEGFELPDCFVVGYGLDYEEQYRHLPFVGVLKEEILGIKQRCS